MKMKVFSIYDVKVESYGRPFYQVSVGQAMRTFQDALSDPQSELAKHAEDYFLYELAEYDDQEGNFVNLDAPQRVFAGGDLVQKGGHE